MLGTVLMLTGLTRSQNYVGGFSSEACTSDTLCRLNRKCVFGSETTYNRVATYLYNITNCLDCKHNCGCQCTAVGSVVQRDIKSRTFCSKSSICRSGLAQKAMNFAADFECEKSFLSAQEHLVTLCGTFNGVCSNGTLKTWQNTVSDAMCDSKKGLDEVGRWVTSVYLMIGLFINIIAF